MERVRCIIVFLGVSLIVSLIIHLLFCFPSKKKPLGLFVFFFLTKIKRYSFIQIDRVHRNQIQISLKT